jgi:serine/threonine-protein kinase
VLTLPSLLARGWGGLLDRGVPHECNTDEDVTVLSSSGADESPKAEVSEGFEDAEARAGEPQAQCFQAGTLIQGRYELQAEVGVGGLGAVWSARHLGFNQGVALKFLKPELSNHAEAVSRFNTEARACFVLRSEHVVRVLDVDSHAGSPFIVMELLDGTDLRRVLDGLDTDTGEALDPALVVDYALQVCEGLCAAHASGIVHRDIKPENLFLHGTGTEACIKLLDFGVSQVEAAYEHDPLLGHMETAAAVGTPPYMSPEQLSGSAVDARSDVWSLGCVLYELLTGTAPFERGTWQESCAAVLTLQPPAAHTLRPELDPGLCEVVERCLRKDPTQRYSDAAQLAAALAAFGTGQFADYPARCYAQLTGERRSTPELAAVRGMPSELAADSSTAFDWSTLRSSPDARTVIQALFQLFQRALPPRQGVLSIRHVWLAAATLGLLCILSWAHAQLSEEPHIVTPSASLPEAIQPRPVESAALVHIDPLPAALEQGQSEPPKVVEEEHTTKRRSRHSSRHGRYQRRHSQREPDVGF